MKTLDDKVRELFDEYDRRKAQLSKRYDELWDSAFTAEGILAVNEWHDKEQEKLASWWRKELRQLSEQMRSEA